MATREIYSPLLIFTSVAKFYAFQEIPEACSLFSFRQTQQENIWIAQLYMRDPWDYSFLSGYPRGQLAGNDARMRARHLCASGSPGSYHCPFH